MTTVDDLWFLADEAQQQAQQTRHRLREQYGDVREFDTTKRVSRRRFRTVAERIQDNGAPYGAHTLALNPDDELLLVRHDGVCQWVLPGGESHADEGFREAAMRELREEAGIASGGTAPATYDGLGLLGEVRFYADDHTTWGVLPVFEARVARPVDPTVSDPDDEISAARWFETLPEDTRDREILRRWRQRRTD